jgi:hypothetical protein
MVENRILFKGSIDALLYLQRGPILLANRARIRAREQEEPASLGVAVLCSNVQRRLAVGRIHARYIALQVEHDLPNLCLGFRFSTAEGSGFRCRGNADVL